MIVGAFALLAAAATTGALAFSEYKEKPTKKRRK